VLTDVAPPGGAASAARYRHTLFSIYDMSLSVDSPLKGAPRIEKPEKDLPLGELEARIVELRADPHGRAPYLIEWHKRYALPFAALVFALVAFPLAIRSHRGGRSIALAASLGILLAYYVLMTSLEGVALRLTVAPWLAIWAPNTIFALAGAILLAATAREWRLPAMPALWRALGRLQRRAPAPRVSAVRAHAPGAARDSTHIIDRYLVREFVTFMAVGLAVAAALFVVIDLLQTLDRYLRVKPPLLYILEHFAYRLPPALHDGLPVIMLVATIFLFLTLSRYHELTAMKAAGLSLYRVSLPILGIGVVVAAAAGLFQELVLPGLNEHGDEVDRVKIRGQAPRHLQSRQRLWVRSSDTRFYRIELLHPGTNDMYGVTILEVDKDFRLTDRLDARRAHWTPAGWEFSEGALREVRPDGQVQTVPFVWTALDIKEEMEDFIRIQKPITSMSYRELKEYIGQLEAAGFQARKYLVELYSKLSFPLVNLIMVLVAIPFALQSPRHGRLFGVGLAVAIMAGYLVVHYVALAFARADLLPPLLAAWTANVIFLGIGVSLLLRART
jgi:lipopolysaccharide export system permease protein